MRSLAHTGRQAPHSIGAGSFDRDARGRSFKGAFVHRPRGGARLPAIPAAADARPSRATALIAGARAFGSRLQSDLNFSALTQKTKSACVIVDASRYEDRDRIRRAAVGADVDQRVDHVRAFGCTPLWRTVADVARGTDLYSSMRTSYCRERRLWPTGAGAGRGQAGGEGGIRTLDTLASMPHFECGAFNHSATSPGCKRVVHRGRLLIAHLPATQAVAAGAVMRHFPAFDRAPAGAGAGPNRWQRCQSKAGQSYSTIAP